MAKGSRPNNGFYKAGRALTKSINSTFPEFATNNEYGIRTTATRHNGNVVGYYVSVTGDNPNLRRNYNTDLEYSVQANSDGTFRVQRTAIRSGVKPLNVSGTDGTGSTYRPWYSKADRQYKTIGDNYTHADTALRAVYDDLKKRGMFKR